MSVHVLMVNPRGSSWDFIPNEMWRSILFRFAVPTCDGVSFDSVTAQSGIQRFNAFTDHQPAFVRNDEYRPYSYPVDADTETYRKSVAVFQFDRWTAELMSHTDFNAWNVGNVGSDADEIVFWVGLVVKLHAIPYEGQAYFHDLTATERELLLTADTSITQHLHAV